MKENRVEKGTTLRPDLPALRSQGPGSAIPERPDRPLPPGSPQLKNNRYNILPHRRKRTTADAGASTKQGGKGGRDGRADLSGTLEEVGP